MTTNSLSSSAPEGKPELTQGGNSKPNAGISDLTDGRKKYEWASGYPKPAKDEIFLEACFLFVVFFASLFLIFAAWKNWAAFILPLSLAEAVTLKKFLYYASSGMLGGIIFGMKYFYRMVARGYWHQDRRCWRFMSPFIATAISTIVGVMIDAGIMAAQKPIVAPVV